MLSFPQKIWLISLFLLLCLGAILFQHFVYRGTLNIQGVPPPFTVTIEDWGTEECTALPCKISISPGEWKIQAEKEGYGAALQTGEVSFQSETPLVFSLQKTPEIFPYTGKLPPPHIFSPPEKNTLFHLDTFSFTGGKLFSGDRVMTSFPETLPIGVSTDEVGRGVWAFSSAQLFWVATNTAQKRVVYQGGISAFRPLHNGAGLVEGDQSLVYISPRGEKISLPNEIDPQAQKTCMTDPGKIFGLSTTYRGTEAVLWDMAMGNVTPISVLSNFTPENFLYADCIAPHTVLLIFQEGEPLLLVF